MDEEKEAAHEEAMRHMKQATELLRESLKIHRAEMDGLISSDEAIPLAIGFNERAASESNLASEAIRDFLDDEPVLD